MADITQPNEFRQILDQLGALTSWDAFVDFIASDLIDAIEGGEDHSFTFDSLPNETFSVEAFTRQLYAFVLSGEFSRNINTPFSPAQVAAIQAATVAVGERFSAVFTSTGEVSNIRSCIDGLAELSRQIAIAIESSGSEEDSQRQWQEVVASAYAQNTSLIAEITKKITELKELAFAKNDTINSLTQPLPIEPNKDASKYIESLQQKAENGRTQQEQQEARELLQRIEAIVSQFDGYSQLQAEAKKILEKEIPTDTQDRPIERIRAAVMDSKQADLFTRENLEDTLLPYWLLVYGIYLPSDGEVFDEVGRQLNELNSDLEELRKKIQEPFAAARKQQVEALSQSILQASTAAAPADAGGGSDDDEEEDEEQKQRQAQAADRFRQLSQQLAALSTITGSILQTNSLPGTSDRILNAFQSIARDHLGGKELPVDNPVDFLLAVEDQINAQTSLSEDFFATYENFLEALEKSLNRFSPTAPEVERPESELPTATVPTPFIVPGVGEIDPAEVDKARIDLGEITRVQALLVNEAETFIREQLESKYGQILTTQQIEQLIIERHDDLSQLLWSEYLRNGGLAGGLTSFSQIAQIWIESGNLVLSSIEVELGYRDDYDFAQAQEAAIYEERLKSALQRAGFEGGSVEQLLNRYSTPQAFGSLESAVEAIQGTADIDQLLQQLFNDFPELSSLVSGEDESAIITLRTLLSNPELFSDEKLNGILFDPKRFATSFSNQSALTQLQIALTGAFSRSDVGNLRQQAIRFRELANKYQSGQPLTAQEKTEFEDLIASFFPLLQILQDSGLINEIYGLTQGVQEIRRAATELRTTARQQSAVYQRLQSNQTHFVNTGSFPNVASPSETTYVTEKEAQHGRGNLALKKILYTQYTLTSVEQEISYTEFAITIDLLMQAGGDPSKLNVAQQIALNRPRAYPRQDQQQLNHAADQQMLGSLNRGGIQARKDKLRSGIAKARMMKKLLATGGNPAALAATLLADPKMREQILKRVVPIILSLFVLSFLPLLLMLLALIALAKWIVGVLQAVWNAITSAVESVAGFFTGGGAEIASSAIPASQSALSATAMGTKAALAEAQAAAAKTGGSVITTSNAVITGVSTASTSAALIAIAILGPFMMLTLLTVIVMTVIGGSMNDLPFEGVGSGSEWLLTEDTACLNIDITSFERSSLEEDLPRFEAAAVRAMQNSDARAICDLLTDNNHRVVIAVNERWIMAGRSRSGSTSELGFSSNFIIDSRDWSPDNLVFTIFHELAHVLQDFSDLTSIYTQAANGQLIRSYPLENSNSESSAEAMAWYLMGEPAPNIYSPRNGVDVNVTLSTDYPNIYRAYQNFFVLLN